MGIFVTNATICMILLHHHCSFQDERLGTGLLARLALKIGFVDQITLGQIERVLFGIGRRPSPCCLRSVFGSKVSTSHLQLRWVGVCCRHVVLWVVDGVVVDMVGRCPLSQERSPNGLTWLQGEKRRD